LFGLDVRNWLPGAYIQFLRVDGDSLAADVINDREIFGDLLSVLRELDALVDAQLAQFPVATSALRERVVESYPKVAVRELLMNAVMHRDYASTAPLRITWLNDRIEIQSPGGLYGEASPQNFPSQTSYRNPVVAEALKALGYVNRYGRGVLRAQDVLAANGSPPPEFQFDAGYVLATIRRRT
jgi:ATP-dependent DNA helicase RecG